MGNISQRIKKLRLENNMSQLELAKKLNIGNSTLSQYESGKRLPSDDIKIKLSRIFNVSVDYLLGITNIRTHFKDENKEEKNEITTKAYHNLDVEGLPDEAIRQVEEYIEFLKQKYNSDGALKKKDSK